MDVDNEYGFLPGGLFALPGSPTGACSAPLVAGSGYGVPRPTSGA